MKSWKRFFEVTFPLMGVGILIIGSLIVGYYFFRINHPGAPWWGFLLHE